MAKKTPNPTDRYVGSRVRMRRIQLDMSQTTLGEALDLTFQQVQKYEKGTNRIGASRMQQIAAVLRVPVGFFFEGAPPLKIAPDGIIKPIEDERASEGDDFLATWEGARIVRAWKKIPDPTLRMHVIRMLERIGGLESDAA